MNSIRIDILIQAGYLYHKSRLSRIFMHVFCLYFVVELEKHVRGPVLSKKKCLITHLQEVATDNTYLCIGLLWIP